MGKKEMFGWLFRDKIEDTIRSWRDEAIERQEKNGFSESLFNEIYELDSILIDYHFCKMVRRCRWKKHWQWVLAEN